MRKRILLPLVLMLVASAAFSQGTIKNNSYFTLSWNRAVSKYGTIVDNESSKNLRTYYKNKYGDDLNHYSGALTVGANFYIHPIGWLIEGFKAGLCIDFIDLGADYYRFPDATRAIGGVKSTDTENYNDLNVYYSLNAGLVATISPAKSFYIDLTAKVCPTFAVNYFRIPAYQLGYASNSPIFERRNAGLEYGGYEVVAVNGTSYDDSAMPSSLNYVPTKNEEDTGIGLGFNYSFGLDFRYSKFLIGCEWVLGNINYSYDVWDKQKIHTQHLKIKVGLSFE